MKTRAPPPTINTPMARLGMEVTPDTPVAERLSVSQLHRHASSKGAAGDAPRGPVKTPPKKATGHHSSSWTSTAAPDQDVPDNAGKGVYMKRRLQQTRHIT